MASGQNPFCTNIVMLHIKSKVMKSRIQWCKNFAPGVCLGVTRGQKVGIWVLFIPRHTIVAGYYGFTLVVRVSIGLSYGRASVFHFRMIT